MANATPGAGSRGSRELQEALDSGVVGPTCTRGCPSGGGDRSRPGRSGAVVAEVPTVIEGHDLRGAVARRWLRDFTVSIDFHGRDAP